MLTVYLRIEKRCIDKAYYVIYVKWVGDNMEIEIIKSNGYEWYKDCIGKRFTFHSESRKGGRNKYVVRLNKEDRHLMNGYNYGWVLKEHCKIVLF